MGISLRAHGVVSQNAIELVGISKTFGDVVALAEASFSMRPGTVHAPLGENGAGKTSLMRVAFGMLSADAGTIPINGEAVRFQTPSEAIARGIGMVCNSPRNLWTVAYRISSFWPRLILLRSLCWL